MDLWDLVLILFGAAMAYAFGELRAYFDRKEQRTVREQDRAARIAEAAAERNRALQMRIIEATRRTFISSLDHRIEFGTGNAAMVARIDMALIDSGHLDHFDPTLIEDSGLLARITSTNLEIDHRGLGNSQSWDYISRLNALKLEVNEVMLRQERRVARGEEPKSMKAGEAFDGDAMSAVVGQIEEWNSRMQEAFPSVTRPMGASAVTNPMPSTGGADREEPEQTRRKPAAGTNHQAAGSSDDQTGE